MGKSFRMRTQNVLKLLLLLMLIYNVQGDEINKFISYIKYQRFHFPNIEIDEEYNTVDG